MIRQLIARSLLLVALASPASAALLEVTISGTIASGFDQDGSVFGLGPGGDPTGLPISIVFVIDTARAPGDAMPSAAFGHYDAQRYNGLVDPAVDFLRATWTVNGISRSAFAPTRDQVDTVTINDSAAAGGTDSYSIRDGSWDGSLTTNDRLFYVTLTAIVAPDLTTGDALEQPFTSLNAVPTAQSCGQCAGFWEDHTNGRNENAMWSLLPTGLSISYRAVPEPGLAWLLAAGFAPLARSRFRRR